MTMHYANRRSGAPSRPTEIVAAMTSDVTFRVTCGCRNDDEHGGIMGRTCPWRDWGGNGSARRTNEHRAVRGRASRDNRRAICPACGTQRSVTNVCMCNAWT